MLLFYFGGLGPAGGLLSCCLRQFWGVLWCLDGLKPPAPFYFADAIWHAVFLKPTRVGWRVRLITSYTLSGSGLWPLLLSLESATDQGDPSLNCSGLWSLWTRSGHVERQGDREYSILMLMDKQRWHYFIIGYYEFTVQYTVCAGPSSPSMPAKSRSTRGLLPRY
jgi:hypothetical protein